MHILKRWFSNFIKFIIKKWLFFYYDKSKNTQNSNFIIFQFQRLFYIRKKQKNRSKIDFGFLILFTQIRIILLLLDLQSSLNIFLHLRYVLLVLQQIRDIRNDQHLHRNRYNRSFLGLKLLLKL